MNNLGMRLCKNVYLLVLLPIAFFGQNCSDGFRTNYQTDLAIPSSITDLPPSPDPTGSSNANKRSVHAKSCLLGDVEAALNSIKVVNGIPESSVINIPPGSCDWKAQGIALPAGIEIKGFGKNLTRIKRSVATNTPLIAFNCTNGKAAVFSGMSLEGLKDQTTLDKGLSLQYGCREFEVYESSFSGFGHAGVEISNNTNQGIIPTGIVYKSDFVDNFKVSYGYGVVVVGDGTWPTPKFGSTEAVYVEENFFSGNRHSIASNAGSIYVFRYNTIHDNAGNWIAVDAHGQSLAPKRGSRAFEIYRNNLSQSTGNTGVAGVGIRGGEGVIFDNNISNYTNPIFLTVENSANCSSISYPLLDQPQKVYIWNNLSNNAVSKISIGAPYDCSNLLQLGRDYFTYQKPNYVPLQFPHPGRQKVN